MYIHVTYMYNEGVYILSVAYDTHTHTHNNNNNNNNTVHSDSPAHRSQDDAAPPQPSQPRLAPDGQGGHKRVLLCGGRGTGDGPRRAAGDKGRSLAEDSAAVEHTETTEEEPTTY